MFIFQRIVGSNVIASLKRFGAGLLRHQSDTNDVDENNYPDVIASAIDSNDVIVLLTRPVVVVSAVFTESTSSVVNVVDCLRNANQPCVKVEVMIDASDVRNAINGFGKMIITLPKGPV